MARMRNECVRRVTLAALATMAMVVIGSTPLAAQTVVDATTAEFQPSADHSRTLSDGTPLVTSYLFQIYPVGSSTPSHAINIGKPAPGTDGLIRFQFSTLLTTPLIAGTTYQATVSAVGPGGTAASTPSNTFGISTPCA